MLNEEMVNQLYEVQLLIFHQQEILNQLVDTGRILLTLPRSLERVVTKLETGQIEVKLADSPRNGRSRN